MNNTAMEIDALVAELRVLTADNHHVEALEKVATWLENGWPLALTKAVRSLKLAVAARGCLSYTQSQEKYRIYEALLVAIEREHGTEIKERIRACL